MLTIRFSLSFSPSPLQREMHRRANAIHYFSLYLEQLRTCEFSRPNIRYFSSLSANQREVYTESRLKENGSTPNVTVNPKNGSKYAGNETMSSCLRKLREAYPNVICKVEDSPSYVRAIETLSACGINYSSISLHEAIHYQESNYYSIFVAFEVGHFQPAIINELIKAKVNSNSINSNLVVDISFAEGVEFSYLRLKEMLEPIQPRLVKLRSGDIHNGKLHAENLQNYREWLDSEAPHLCQFAADLNSILCITGPIDMIIDDTGKLISKILFDTKYLNRIPGTNAAIGALCASAISALPQQQFMAVTTACTVYKYAAREASKDSKGPGSLSNALLDQLYRTFLSPDKLIDDMIVFTTLDEIQKTSTGTEISEAS